MLNLELKNKLDFIFSIGIVGWREEKTVLRKFIWW
jgi:hypothetical protein